MLGFGFFREFWGKPEIRAISRLAIKYWFESAEIDMLYGTVLRENRIARRFALETGVKQIAELPLFIAREGKLLDAMLFGISRQEFLG